MNYTRDNTYEDITAMDDTKQYYTLRTIVYDMMPGNWQMNYRYGMDDDEYVHFLVSAIQMKLGEYDPTKGSMYTYCKLIVNREIQKLYQYHRAEKRTGIVVSMNQPAENEYDTENVNITDLVAYQEYEEEQSNKTPLYMDMEFRHRLSTYILDNMEKILPYACKKKKTIEYTDRRRDGLRRLALLITHNDYIEDLEFLADRIGVPYPVYLDLLKTIERVGYKLILEYYAPQTEEIIK